MSKLFWGGLRVGWIRGPAHLAARLSPTKATADLGTRALSQPVSARLLEHHDDVAARAAPRRGALAAWVELPERNATAFT
jgi:DNA-binding transcriptional MocR family regulator